MFCDKQDGSCKSNQKIWAITSQNGKKVHRLTFSESLAKHIVDNYGDYNMERMSYIVGDKLTPGEKSKSGLYALVSKKSDIVLRISLIKEIAEIHCDESNRYLAEAWIL